MRNQPGLAEIDADALRDAIREFNTIGRARLLRRYGFSRSSKYYFIYKQKIYDTKALLGAAYFHATGRRLSNHRFSGGNQTLAVFRRIEEQGAAFRGSEVFEDGLGELSNLVGEFDRLPSANATLRSLGFSKWIPIGQFAKLHTRVLPGVYVIADCHTPPIGMSVVDPSVVYIGETVDQNLQKRLYQFRRSIDSGSPGHSGGITLWQRKRPNLKLWLSIRSFPLGYGLAEKFGRSLRASQIRLLERKLLHEYILANNVFPVGNSK